MTEAGTAEKRVSWVELFFDLVFVLAVTRVSELLHTDHSAAGLGRAIVVFVPIYWLWVGTSIQANVGDTARPLMRIRILAIALAGLFMALAVPHAYENLGLLFAFAYWAGRIVLALGLPFPAGSRGWLVNPVFVSVALTGPMLIVGGVVHGPARELVWALAAVIDLSTPTVLRRWLRYAHYDAGHLSERFGAFVLIALGESVVSIGAVADTAHLTLAEGSAVAAGFAMCCGLWWVYFHFAADAMRYALATAKVQLDITRLVLSYGHVTFIAAIIAMAVGLREAVVSPSHALSPGILGLLYGGCALYLAGFGLTRWWMFRLMSWTRLAGAAAVLVLWPLALHVPATGALLVLAAVLGALNLWEWRRVQRAEQTVPAAEA